MARRFENNPPPRSCPTRSCPPRRAATPASPIQGLTQTEAARVLEVSVTTVNRRLSRGLQLLTKADLFSSREVGNSCHRRERGWRSKRPGAKEGNRPRPLPGQTGRAGDSCARRSATPEQLGMSVKLQEASMRHFPAASKDQATCADGGRINWQTATGSRRPVARRRAAGRCNQQRAGVPPRRSGCVGRGPMG